MSLGPEIMSSNWAMMETNRIEPAVLHCTGVYANDQFDCICRPVNGAYHLSVGTLSFSLCNTGEQG
jgi:hypothetical protein